jgi:flagellum-specific ATP synthase
MSALDSAMRTVSAVQPMRITGRVSSLRGLTVLARDLPLPVGSLVEVTGRSSGQTPARREYRATNVLGEVVGFNGAETILMMLGSASGVCPGDRVVGRQAAQTVPVGDCMLGRCLNGLGEPIDGLGPLHDTSPRPIDPAPIGAMARRRVTEPIYTGLRAIDLFTTLGRGQRMGIFAGPGVGKSTMLGAVARNATSDVNIIALIGERGREVKDFLAHSLGPEGLARSVVVVATSDESPLMRVRAALVAATAAEHFRDAGRAVLLMMDSVTRFAHAHRQIGLSIGEPPATRGYTPSVFAAMAKLLERAGALERIGGPDPVTSAAPAAGSRVAQPRSATPPGGSITGLYAVLVEGDDMTEPVSDAARGILDGHLVLSRALAQRGHYPAIDVLDSVSRVADEVSDAAHISARRQVVKLLAAYRKIEDLLQIGAYAKGSSAESDAAIQFHPRLLEILQQGPGEKEGFDQARARLLKVAIDSGAAVHQAIKGGIRP